MYEQYRKRDFGAWIGLPWFPCGRDRDEVGGEEWNQCACDQDPDQLEEYSCHGKGESGGQLGMEAEGQE